MEWITHCLSGLAAGYTVTGGDWKGALVGGVASVIPDLDEHRSKFGKLFYPVSFTLNKTVGHRTFTHSLLFVVLAGIILFPFFDWWVVTSTVTGIMAHIVGDMLTGKVRVLYPAKKNLGLHVSRYMFTIIDKSTAILLSTYIFWVIFINY